MAIENTPNKAFEKPYVGHWARQTLGRDMRDNLDALDTILGRFDREEHTLADTETAAIAGGEAVLARAFLFDGSNDDVADCFLRGDGGEVAGMSTTNGAFDSIGGQGTDGQTNVYWSGSQYEIENQTGGDVTYEVMLVRLVS